MIREGLAGKTVLVTGSTGFLGKTIVEKILWSLPDVRLKVAIRSSARRSAADRLEREVLSSPAFDRLRGKHGEEGFKKLAASLEVVEIDLGRDGLGLSQSGREQLAGCDVVIHSAAAVEFDNPADLSAQTNLLGAARMAETLRDAGVGHLVHISTAYVGSLLRGLVEEEPPHDPGLNWRHEAEVIGGLRPLVEAESRSPQVLKELSKQARSRMGPAGVPQVARLTERLRERWVKDRLVERGRQHARAMGFADIYSFTKAMAERAVMELHGDLPVSVVRPSIIESALAEPFPGWLEGFRMAEPLLLAFGRHLLDDFPGLPDGTLDIIPVDYVVNTVLAVAASPPEKGGHRVYHAASGTRNPLNIHWLANGFGQRYFTEHPLRDRYGQAIGPPKWTFPTLAEVRGRADAMRRLVDGLQYVVERIPRTDMAATSDRLNENRDRLERAISLFDLYGIYTSVDAVFDTAHTYGLWERLPEAEKREFPFDAAAYDWWLYLSEVHMPTVIRMARAETAAGKGKQPTGSTEPKPERDRTVEVIRRRAGRADVLAVFDVDGTLVETNVIEYFVWMRLKSQPLSRWPRFLGDLLSQAPRWLELERHSRAEFQRSFYRNYAGLDYEEMKQLGREAMNEVTLRRLYPEGVRRIRAHQEAGHRVLLLTGALDVVVEPLAEMLGVELDCAHLLLEDGALSGRLAAPPPAGEARSALLERYAAANGIALAESFAYADSLSDLPMLEIAGTPVAVNPDARLSSIARQRGWRVERWTMPPGNWRLPVPDPRSKTYQEQFV